VIEKAILMGPIIGELAWEFMRFSPMLPYYYTQYLKQNVKFIVMTRPDRFDMYGQYADILVPLRIDGDGELFKPDCFRMIGFSIDSYNKIVKKFNKQYKERFDIIEHIYPKLENKQYAQKQQFSKNKMKFKWKPRIENDQTINSYIPNDKPLVVLAPRYRDGLRRNWPHWNQLYDLIYNSKLMESYNFVICGKNPDYIPDKNKRFYDINDITITNDISIIGLTIKCIKRSILTVGSQSGIPNISMMLGTDVLEWGHQKILHSQTYNIKKTPVNFLEDMHYNIDPKIIFDKMIKLLKKEK
jgi:hypothetical protein